MTSSRLEYLHARSPAIFASCGDQSFSFRTKRGYKVNSQAYQFVIMAVFNREHDSAAKPHQQKTLIYFARPTKTAMLRRLLLRRLRKPLRYSQISPIFKQVNGYTVMKYCRHPEAPSPVYKLTVARANLSAFEI